MSKAIHDYLLPVLYKKTSTGKIQQWKIWVKGTTINTEFGQVGGKLQTTSDPIKAGKNEGKENETSAREQACKEAKASWTKKKKSGYVEDASDAELDKTDDVIEGGILPMLAKVFEDQFKEEMFKDGICVQPKLDGLRCIAIWNGKETTLWSRTRKRITSCPHIERAISTLCEKKKIQHAQFDGELYSHEYKSDFEKIVSAVRKQEPSEESRKIDYHIYDLVSDSNFHERIEYLETLDFDGLTSCIKLVETVMDVSDIKEIENIRDSYLEDGYEGAMIRICNRGYENKRSSQLLKLKTFQDAEFKIVGVEEGRGKLIGHAGAFVCVTKENQKFSVKMSGETVKLKDYLMNFGKYRGKMLTVKFQGLTSDNIPRFPVGMRIREDGM